MNKISLALLGFLLSIAGTLCAQTDPNSAADRLFEPPPNSIDINYTVRLEAGNKLRLDLANGYDVRIFSNLDSLLRVFLDDMQAFRDSLADPLTIKTIDYLIDTSGKKKLRIRQCQPPATTFLLERPEPAILRIEQDTIRILFVTRPGESPAGLTVNGLRYDRVCFIVNRFADLPSLLQRGLNGKIAYIRSQQTVRPPVNLRPFDYEIQDSVVSTDMHAHHRSQLEINASVAAENYKSYFTPSFLVNAGVNLFHDRNEYEISVAWEPLFLFSTDPQGQLHTYRNDLVLLRYSYQNLEKPAAAPPTGPKLGFDPTLSIGYIVHREGPFFPRESFRLMLGAARGPGGFKLEPCIFFNDFFRGVTPGLRLSLAAF